MGQWPQRFFQLSDVDLDYFRALRGLQDVNIPTVICFIAY
jgi:hypothetical protein